MGEKSFRTFLEEQEQPFIASLKDVLGIDPEDLENEPQVASFFPMGLTTNLGSYELVRFNRNKHGKITHAVVKPTGMDKKYKDEKGEFKQIDGGETDQKEITVRIEDLDKLLSQDFQPSPTPEGM
jgi:hypothetical protein